MASLENAIEQIEVALLQGQASLSGFQIHQFASDSSADKDRIVVKCSPREVALYGKDQITPVSWMFKCDTTVYLATRSTSTLDTVISAIEAAHATGASIPSAAQTLATANFPNGLQCDPTNEGAQDHGENVRTRTKTFRYVSII